MTKNEQPSIWTEGWAPRGRIPVIVVKSGKTAGGEKSWRFTRSFTLGRNKECDVPLEDLYVSGHHASIEWLEGQWWIEDNGSKNGTYLDGQKISRAVLPHVCNVQMGHNGPILNLEILPPEADTPLTDEPMKGEVTMLADHYFADRSPETMGDRTRLIHHAFQRVEKKHKKRYRTIIGIVGFLLLATATALYIQSRRVARLEQLHETAEQMFYTMKSLELQMAQVRLLLAGSADPKRLQDFEAMQKLYRSQQDRYGEFREQLGISQKKLTREEWLIYKVARQFGECDVNMPPEFIQEVHDYIKKWQSSSRFHDDITLARDSGYIPIIAKAMMKHGMPPQFLYLAMQESDFRRLAYGKQTYAGIAKGMWQFIPATGRSYGLTTGPYYREGRPDPFDERHDVHKSTNAAAKYLRDLYETEAKASGLLVMACYNWRQDIILPIVKKMPEDPRQRNFWSFIKIRKLPEETYNYVFMIFSAAVIGEDPKYFKFDFDNPLAPEVTGMAVD